MNGIQRKGGSCESTDKQLLHFKLQIVKKELSGTEGKVVWIHMETQEAALNRTKEIMEACNAYNRTSIWTYS